MEVDDAAHASDFINRLDNLHHRNKHMKTVIGEISGKVQLAAKNLRKVEKQRTAKLKDQQDTEQLSSQLEQVSLSPESRLLQHKYTSRTPEYLHERRMELFTQKVRHLRLVSQNVKRESVELKPISFRRNELNPIVLRRLERDAAAAGPPDMAPAGKGSGSWVEGGRGNEQVQHHDILKKFQEFAQQFSVPGAEPSTFLEATTNIRKALSCERNPPNQEAIESGVLPHLVRFLYEADPQLVLNAAWALTNVASGTSAQTRTVVNLGVIPVFQSLILSDSIEVAEQAIWGLGNIAGDCTELRDLVIQCGTVQAMVSLFSKEEPLRMSMLRNAVWMCSNLVRGKPKPQMPHIAPLIRPLSEFLVKTDDVEVLTDCCWALSYFSDGPNDQIQAVIDTGVIPQLVNMLSNLGNSIVVPALRTLGNIVTGDDQQTQAVLNAGALPHFARLLSNQKRSIRKECAWSLSNVTAGTVAQIQLVIDQGIVPPLINIIKEDEFEVAKEAVWAISNLVEGGSVAQHNYLIENGGVETLCKMLGAQEKIISVALTGLKGLIQKAANAESIRSRIENCGALDQLEQLQEHAMAEIADVATTILQSFDLDHDEEEDFDFGAQF